MQIIFRFQQQKQHMPQSLNVLGCEMWNSTLVHLFIGMQELPFRNFNNQENIREDFNSSPENDKGPCKENEGPASSARISPLRQG